MKNADIPAMPTPITEHGTTPHGTEPTYCLTKREMFAMHAMQGLSTSGGEGWLIAHAPVIAVKIADALIAELEKSQ